MWHEYSALEACIQALSRDIVERMQNCLHTRGFCTLAVSGGRSPIPLFKQLSQADLNWSRVRVQLVDERYVAPDHPDSNERLVRQHLLTGKAAHAEFIGLYREGATVAQAVDAANEEARQADVAVLGMGDDGHTASLFPGAPQLEYALAPDAAHYLHVTPRDAPHERITLSLTGLRACGHLVMYISGEHKQTILREAEKAYDRRRPVSFVAADPGNSFDVYWHP